MSGAGSPYSLVKSHNTDTGRRDISRNRNLGARSRNITGSVSRTRSKTPYKEAAKTTLRTKIASGRSATSKKATCMKKSEPGKENTGNKNENPRLRVTRLAYSKNPTMNPILARLSKLNMETMSSTSRESNNICSSNSESGHESIMAETSQSQDNNPENNNALETIEPPCTVDLNQSTHAPQDSSSKTNGNSKNNQGISGSSQMKQLSEPDIKEQSQTDTGQTDMNPPEPRIQETHSQPKRTYSQLNGASESIPMRIPDMCVISHPLRVQAAMHQPTFSAHHSPILRREARECRPLQEPKNENAPNPLVTHVELMQPSTSTFQDVNVVTIPSDTYAACQAAFSYAAVSAAETLDNVLVQLQVPSSSDGGMTHVSKVVVPGASSRHMTSALSILHSSGSNSSVNSQSSDTECSSVSTSSASESEWDDGPKVAEADFQRPTRRRESSRSSDRSSLFWRASGEDEGDKLSPLDEI